MCCQSSDCNIEHKKKENNIPGKESLLYVKNREELKNIDENQDKTFKKEGKLRLYFYGENILKLLIDQTTYDKLAINQDGYQMGYEKALNWEYYIFDKITKENNKTISNIIEDNFLNSDFFEIIIVTVNQLFDEESKLFFKHFQKYSNQKSKQPFILFLTKNEEKPDIKKLYDLIDNEYFDKRTIFALKYPSKDNENETQAILNLICKFRNYYHEEGDSFETFNDEITTNYKFNILVCGRAGTGKSSFINEFLGNRKAKEGEGLSVTHNIVTYCHPTYPINISDTPGFEDEQTLSNVKKLLDSYNKKLLDARKKINLIIYLFPYSERSVLSLELPLLENLMGYNTEIIFVMNFVTESPQKKHYQRIHQISIDSLQKVLPKEFNIRLYPINLYSQIDDDDPENIKVIKSFGLDNLFSQIYDIFKSSITDLDKIKEIKSSNDLFTFFKKNKLFNHFEQVNDLFISFRSEITNIILSYGRKNFFSFDKDKNMEEMANLIYTKCLGKKCTKYHEYLQKLFYKQDIESYFDEFTQTISLLKSYNKKIHTMVFYKKIHDHKTIALGYLCMMDIQKIFEDSPNIFMENDELNYDLLLNLCCSYNLAIKGFKILANNYEKKYEEENKKNKETIKKLKSKNLEDVKEDNKNEIQEIKEKQVGSEDKIDED
jgi:GTP-binding protein EngB required for normal cell division